MARLYLIQRGRTDWDDQGRLENLAGVPLSPEGCRQVQRLADELAGRGLNLVYCGPAQAEQQSAEMLAQAMAMKVRCSEDLAGVDFGLWQGLTTQQVLRSHGRLFRQWQAQPSQVCPPGGETVAAVQRRLCEAIGGICRRHRSEAVMLVLAPTAMALLRMAMERVDLDRLWERVLSDAAWSSYDTDGRFH